MTPVAIWTAVQIDYALIACTIPCLRPFALACNTGWGNNDTNLGTTMQKGSYRLSSMDRSRPHKSGVHVSTSITVQSERRDRLAADDGKQAGVFVHGNAGSIASDDSGRRIIGPEMHVVDSELGGGIQKDMA